MWKQLPNLFKGVASDKSKKGLVHRHTGNVEGNSQVLMERDIIRQKKHPPTRYVRHWEQLKF